MNYYDTCECITKLMGLGLVMPYCEPYNTLASGYTANEGDLCIVRENVEDRGYYDDYNWINDIITYKELYPIKYCPICGKEIQYKRSNQLTKNI